MKSIVFSNSVKNINPGSIILDFSKKSIEHDLFNFNVIDTKELYEANGKAWLDSYLKWMGALNSCNDSLAWWSHTCTSKSLLSTPLGERFIEVQAICNIAKKDNEPTLYILGVSPGQIESVRMYLGEEEFNYSVSLWYLIKTLKVMIGIRAFFNIFRRALSVMSVFLNYRHRKFSGQVDVCLFTYVDGSRRKGFDNYFGQLDRMMSYNKKLSIVYLAYIYIPYRKRLRELFDEKTMSPYLAIFSILRLKDYLSSLLLVICELKNCMGTFDHNYLGNKAYKPLLQEGFINDIEGVLLYNIFVYKSIRNFLRASNSRFVVYPFENKSVEKMIIQAVRDENTKTMIIGYHHTSLTPRHTNLIFSHSEASNTPLPDKIVTTGKISREYLETLGNYPDDIFVTGCALRQTWNEESIRPNNTKGPIKILLALSSSKSELIHALQFIRNVKNISPELIVGVRAHINFPITLLPSYLFEWAKENTIDLSGTVLEENLNWCDIVAYVSSTVALESLIRRKPIINFSIGDLVSTDPVIGKPPFHWAALHEREMVSIVKIIRDLTEGERLSLSDGAVKYVHEYLTPPSNRLIKSLCLELKQ